MSQDLPHHHSSHPAHLHRCRVNPIPHNIQTQAAQHHCPPGRSRERRVQLDFPRQHLPGCHAEDGSHDRQSKLRGLGEQELQDLHQLPSRSRRRSSYSTQVCTGSWEGQHNRHH